MLKQSLDGNWSVRAVGDLSEVPSELRGAEIPVRVPGCVHTDLLRAGKIPDPYLDLNEYKLQWIGRTDWEYRTTFDADPKLFDHERIDLACDGLDTVARIELNGSIVGSTQNMHRSYRFDIRPHLKRGALRPGSGQANELRITFASPVKYAFAMREKLGNRPWVNGAGGPFNFIRKMACNFGWDWGPVLTTCGIWKGVRVEGWSVARIKSVDHRVLDVGEGRVELRVELDHASRDENLRLQRAVDQWLPDQAWMEDPDYKHADNPKDIESTQFLVPRGKPWWPRGYGDQPLQWFWVALSSDKHPCEYLRYDEKTLRFGLRTVELDTSPDYIGSKFVLKVNGEPIFCRGFNWIPDDCFLDRACEPARVRARIQQAVDAGANMLRVWGGGIYETDDFYNICDELGVMVWQDFPFACAMYPEEEPFASEVEAEARENVARLSSHPSLVLWNGNNENLWAYRDWGWQKHEDVVGKTWGKNFYLNLLPKIVKEVDPSRPYWAASPWSGDPDVDNGVHPNDPNHGNMHVWAPWFREDYTTYRNSSPRFCSEFGFQAPANFASIARMVPESREASDSNPFSPRAHAGFAQTPRVGAGAKREDDQLHDASLVPPRDFGSVEMRHRQKSSDAREDGDLRNLRHLSRHFNLPGLAELIESLTIPTPRTMPAPGVVQPLFSSKTPSKANFDDLHYLLQLNQCRALTLGVEWFRSRQPTCMGTLYWQLNDCWPGVTSWSAIDGDGKPKPLWFATRRFYADVLGTIQPDADGRLYFYLINDTDEPFSKRVFFYRHDLDGKQLGYANPKRATVPPRSVGRIQIDPQIATPGDPTREMLWASFTAGEALWFFDVDKNLRYPPPVFDAELERVGDEHHLTIRPKSLLRDIILSPDRLDPEATVSDNVVTLTADQPSFTFVIRSNQPLTKEQLTSPPVFQCANRFGAE